MKKKFIKICFVIMTCNLFFFCSTRPNDKTSQINNVVDNKNIKSVDSIPDDLWYATLTLIPESEVVRVGKLDNEEHILDIKTRIIRDSIIGSIDVNKLSTKNNADSLLKEAIKKGDLAMYSSFTVNNGLLSLELYPYSMYMGEIYNFPPAYDDIFNYFYKLNYILQKDQGLKDKFQYSLNALNENQRNLALYSLVKSYKKGYVDNAKVLAYYFREGLYFPKDVQTANKLDSIYEYRLPIKR